MSTTVEIPLISAPQTFSVVLAGVTYNMTVRWCAPGGFWGLDIADASDNTLVGGIPLITGGDLLEPYEYLGISGALTVVTDYDAGAPPTSTNLGSQSHLYFTTSD